MINRDVSFHTRLLCSAAVVALAAGGAAHAQDRAHIHIEPQALVSALNEFGVKTGQPVISTPELTASKLSPGVKDADDPAIALAQLLSGTGLTYRCSGDTYLIVSSPESGPAPKRCIAAAGAGGSEGDDAGTVQALIVTAQKREENIQDVPIAMSAFTQEDLTRSQVAGGPDLMTQVPNFTFTKTNFSSYSIQIRGIGTQAISATTDAAVAVAFNNTPFIRNRFFEQEFYDLQRVEVLRGPQGTLYGRNATAGVVNIISQKPKFTYESRLSLDVSNYNSHRLEGMLNIPMVDDKVALRIAGAWTKRDGYDTNQITGNRIDGRDLWSSRVSLRVAPTDGIDANLIWEHFQENDDRLRSGKQLCHQDNRTTLGNLIVDAPGLAGRAPDLSQYSNIYSQGCLPASLYSPDSLQAPNGYSLPYYLPLGVLNVPVKRDFNPYASLVQSPDLRVIESTIDPKYRAKDDLVELQVSVDIGHALTLTSETGHNYDTIYSLEDFNRFNTEHGAFVPDRGLTSHRTDYLQPGPYGMVFCDPQLGCADRLIAVDVSRAKSSQFSQEFRLSSNYDGKFNFSLGANFLRYDTMEKYYVFINTLTMLGAMGGVNELLTNALPPWQPNGSDNSECMRNGVAPPDPTKFQLLAGCQYVDPNPIESVNDQGHNYFLSKNPYKLISYAVFGETYYNITPTLKLTAGLRWTVDKKEAPRIPSMLLAAETIGYSVLNVERQEWREPTGRLTLDWKPDLSFTDESLFYGSYAHGYKAGGSNPPPSGITGWGADVAAVAIEQSATKPKTFDPEFVNAFEIGSKNTLLDGRLTLNGDAFYYDYKGYQVSQIIDRSAVNYNFDAKVWGAELEADWRPLENLRLGFKGGFEKTRIANGEHAIDIMDRTAGHSDWVVIRPFPTYPSNCILPLYTFDNGSAKTYLRGYSGGNPGPCENAYVLNLDPVTLLPYVPNPTVIFNDGTVPIGTLGYPNYPGFDPSSAPNHGEGFYKELGGHELPNAPHFTATVTADYTIPLASDWLMTLHTDLYYQSEAWTRVFNTPGYDKLKAYTNINLAAIFSNEDAGWKVMAYVKNVMNRDSITGAFLNSDDTGLTTNVFLTEPRLYGLRVTKEWTGGPWWTGANPNHTGPYPFTVEIGGEVQRLDAPYDTVKPGFAAAASPALDIYGRTEHANLDWGNGGEVKLSYRPQGGVWGVSGDYRRGKANGSQGRVYANEQVARGCPFGGAFGPAFCAKYQLPTKYVTNWAMAESSGRQEHEIVDFAVQRDVGFGALRRSSVGVGVRFANLTSQTRLKSWAIPDWNVPDGWGITIPDFSYVPSTRTMWRSDLTDQRKFEGAGPMLSWEAAMPLVGSDNTGHLDLDWTLSGGAMFGKQKTSLTGTETGDFVASRYFVWSDVPTSTTVNHVNDRRSTSSTVPVADLSLGLSYDVQRIKVGAGYRWERYFNALDTGFDEHRDADLTLDGPYFKIAVGFGG